MSCLGQLMVLLFSNCCPEIMIRVCLHHQVSGCKKNIVDESCVRKCKETSSITNLIEISFFIDKEKGDYHNFYNESNFLNTNIVSDAPNLLANYMIDLRDIKTDTMIEINKSEMITLFENHINRDTDSVVDLEQAIHPITSTQHIKGI